MNDLFSLGLSATFNFLSSFMFDSSLDWTLNSGFETYLDLNLGLGAYLDRNPTFGSDDETDLDLGVYLSLRNGLSVFQDLGLDRWIDLGSGLDVYS